MAGFASGTGLLQDEKRSISKGKQAISVHAMTLAV
jgi:hypothetical protein